MHELRLAQLLRPAPATDRVFFHAVWFRGHNNQRYAALLPRLDRIDAYLLRCSDNRLLRAIQFRTFRRTEHQRNRRLLARMARRYRGLFAVDAGQAQYFDGPVVIDLDDPKFTQNAAAALSRDNVVVCVVTADATARRFEELGVSKPWVVIPQGVDLEAVTPDAVERARTHLRRPGDILVGYVAAWLLSRRDRGGGNPVYNIDHLLDDLWPPIRDRVPEARLVLIGQPSPTIARRCTGRPDIVLVGRLEQHDVLANVAVFDIAVYPRQVEHTVRTIKIAEYMASGVPTVSYDLALAHDVAASGGGVLARSPGDFVDGVVTLAEQPEMRRSMASAAREYAAGWRWSTLAARYRDVLDEYIPRSPSGPER